MNVPLRVHAGTTGQPAIGNVLLLDSEIDGVHRLLQTKGPVFAVDALRNMYPCSIGEAKRCAEYIAENYEKEKFRLLKEILSSPSERE
ncbi:MAG: hypothetical protein AABZ39_00270 [Spirochaetota bacterium]